MALFFVINPVAGRGKALKAWKDLQTQLDQHNISYHFGITQQPGHARNLAAQAVSQGYSECIGVGGDGTLHEMVPALAGTQTALGCIPAGTGNDFARTLGLPRRDPARWLEYVTKATRKVIDLPSADDHLFLNVAGIGFDAMVADTVNREFTNLTGTLPYILAVLKTLARYHNAPLQISLDNGPTKKARCVLVAIGNGQFYGGGMRICPHADVSDGLLDVCIAGDLSKPDVLLTLPKLFSGTHLAHPKCEYTQAKEITIEGPPLPYQTDGQIVGTLPVTFTLRKSALSVLCPPLPDNCSSTV